MSEFSHGPSPSQNEINKTLTPLEKTPQEITNERIQRLEEICTDPSFDDEKMGSALRVYEFLSKEDFKETDKKWSKYFKTNEDWQLYLKLNPNWEDLSLIEINNKPNGNSFYQAIRIWAKREKECDTEAQKQLIDSILPRIKQKDWSNFTTLGDWQEYFNQHPEWQGLSTKEIANTKGGSFYSAFNTWTHETVKDLPENEQQTTRKNLVKKIFPPRYRDWSQLKTIKDWQEEFNKHPEWQRLNTSKLQNIADGRNFYNELNIWTHQATKNLNNQSEKRKALVKTILSLQNKDWSQLKTIKDWQEEFNKHPEWQGLNAQEIGQKEGGVKFYTAFYKWTKTQAEIPPKKLREKFFSKKQTKSSKLKNNDEKVNKIEPEIITPKSNNIIETKINSQTNNNIQVPIIKSQEIDFSQKDNWLINGFTTKIIDTTSETNLENNSNGNNGNGSYNLPFKRELTPSQIIRLMTGKEDQNPEFYANHIGQLATYVIHRGEIGYLLNYFSSHQQNFPKNIADLGAGPSTAYSAYQELEQTIKDFGFQKPHIIDIDKNPEMMQYGDNPTKLECNISEKISLADQQVDMVQSTFVIHHFKPQEILRTLSEANRITKTEGYLNLICSKPFSQSFISGVKQLGYRVITQHGEILTPNNQMSNAISQEFDPETAKRFQNRFKSSFILFAQKINNTENLPSSENFTFDRQKKSIRERKPIFDLKNYNLNSFPLTENIERLTDSVNYQIQQLESIPLKQEGELTPSGNEIKFGYENYSGNLNLIQSLYDKIYTQIKGKFNTLTQEQIDNFNSLRQQIKIAKDYKKTFYRTQIT